MRRDLEEYLNTKTSFEYLENVSFSSVLFKYGDVLVPPDTTYRYTILGFMKYHTGYLRYVGELKDSYGGIKITSRDIKEVQELFKLSIGHILKKL